MSFTTPFAVKLNPYEFATSQQTTDATPTNIRVYTPGTSETAQVRLIASATKSDGSKGAGWEILATARCASDGTLTLLGATTVSAEADAAFAPTLEINVSGSDIVAILTGIASTVINWALTAEVA